MKNFTIKSTIFAISLLGIDSQYSYNKGSEIFKDVSSFKLKRFLVEWNENEKLEELIFSMNIDWTQGWLSIDDCLIDRNYAANSLKALLPLILKPIIFC